MLNPDAAQLQSPAMLTNGLFEFQFNGQSNANYIVEYTTNLTAPANWQTLQFIPFSQGGAIKITDPAPAAQTRFYRVVAE